MHTHTHTRVSYKIFCWDREGVHYHNQGGTYKVYSSIILGVREGGPGGNGLHKTHSRATGDGWEGNGGKVLVLRQHQTALDGLLQVGHRLLVGPLGTMHVNHMLAG